MIKQIKGLNVCYEEYGNTKGETLVFLHGWGQNIEMMKPLGEKLQKDYHIYILDLPGFGNSEEPISIWSVYDYADCIHEFIESFKIKNQMLLGHSFGGKISLAYASKYNTKKLVVFGSPFRKKIEKLSLKIRILKTIKKLPWIEGLANIAKKHMGSTDYKNASPMMRDILVNTVNLDITEDVKKIKCPTLIVWGSNDEQVSVEDAYLLEKLIKDAGVVEYQGCSHYAYLENLGQTINVLNSFLK